MSTLGGLISKNTQAYKITMAGKILSDYKYSKWKVWIKSKKMSPSRLYSAWRSIYGRWKWLSFFYKMSVKMTLTRLTIFIFYNILVSHASIDTTAWVWSQKWPFSTWQAKGMDAHKVHFVTILRKNVIFYCYLARLGPKRYRCWSWMTFIICRCE